MKSKILNIYIFVFLTGVLTYLIRINFAKNLTLELYGFFYAVYSLIFFFGPFRDLGMSESTIYHFNKNKDSKEKQKEVILIGFIPQLFLSIIFSILFFVFQDLIVRNYFKTPLVIPLYNLLLILFSFETIYSTLRVIFRANQKIIEDKIFGFLKFLVILTVSIIGFKIFKTYTIPAYAYLFGNIISIIIMFISFKIKFPWFFKVKATYNKELIKEMFSYALPIMFSTAGSIILMYSDTILLTLMKGAEMVGLYNIAYPLINIVLIFITPIESILFPKIANLYHKKQSNTIKNIISFIYNHILIFTLPLGLMFFGFAELIIKTLFGANYLGATNTLRVFALFFIFMSIRNINFSIIAGIGKPKERSKILYIGAGFNVILDLILIPKFGATGAAIATGLGFLLMSFLTTKLVLKEYPINLHIRTQLKTIFSSLLFVLAIFAFKYLIKLTNPIIEAIIVTIIASLIYLMALFMLKVVNKEKILAFKRMFL